MENTSQNKQNSDSAQSGVSSVLDINKRIERDQKRKQEKSLVNMSKEEIDGHLQNRNTISSGDSGVASPANNRIENISGRGRDREMSQWMESTIPRRDKRRVSVSSVNSDIGRMEKAKESEDAKKALEKNQGAMQTPSRSDMLRAYQKRREAILKAAKTKIESRKENRSDLNAMGFIIILIAFIIAVFSDLLDVVVDGTGIGAFLAPVSSVVTGPIVGFLWWSLGVGDANNKLKKSAKRLLGACGIEAIPLIDILPAMTVLCIINLLDYFGYLDFKDWGKTFDKNRTEDALS